ncbi:hydantoinase B/oxoprolinase family protein [Paraburkholderia acidisoli]|uniref:Hydantoinase B/oxoprolinase family protein n=1 Tax=Paraburkholderia acidisoli TaxID=2571748 RepID=A0A7Z2GR93_9BURK|nr:hydantoinase B/oxoprolinase family protein [Paraburkholderia acidisoli]QGZ66094.1 hydantoinase B/oxoprolinase family protein [Paraburkholderia acidisoli]
MSSISQDKPAASVMDPITLEVLSNALRSITDEIFIALMRSAFSGNIKERRDHSTAIIDVDGRLIAQAEQSLPIHLSGLIGLIDAVREKFPLDDIRPGDLFIANDPYEGGGSHLPDINTAAPVFVDGKLLCFICTIAHHSDIGGARPGSMASGLTEIYQEGIRIPVVRLFSGGEMVKDVFDLVLLNMRMKEERLGDFNAQFAASKLGLRRFEELAQSYDGAMLSEAFGLMLGATERRMRAAIADIPDGTYTFEDYLDGDGIDTTDILIRASVTVAGSSIAIDFDGTAPQVQGNINLVMNGLKSTVAFALKCLLDPLAANNHGLISTVEVTAPLASIVNAVAPASVAHRVMTGMRVVDVVMGALAPVLPQRVTAAANGSNTAAMFYGRHPGGDREYVYFETLGGGGGARLTRDGKDGVQAYLTNTTNLPIEAIETEYPLLIEGYALIEDSAGAGRQRGGLGIRRVVRPLGHVAMFSGAGERFVRAAWGLAGGQSGAPGRFMLRNDDGTVEALPTKPGMTPVRADQQLVIETPGGGGYGAPAERDPARVEIDRQSGAFGAAYLNRNYVTHGVEELSS